MTFKPTKPKQQVRAFGNPKARDKALDAFKKGDVAALVGKNTVTKPIEAAPTPSGPQVSPLPPPISAAIAATKAQATKDLFDALEAAIRDPATIHAALDPINRGADVNALDTQGDTPLMRANAVYTSALLKSPRLRETFDRITLVIESLLKHGADPHALNKRDFDVYQHCALHHVQVHPSLESVEAKTKP